MFYKSHVIFLLGVILVAGCVGQESVDGIGVGGALQLKFSDMGEASDVNITKLEVRFLEISVLRSGAADVNASEVDVNFSTKSQEYALDNSTEWTELSLEEKKVDLADLKGVVELFNSVELPPGKYMQIRFIVRDARLFAGGEEKNISARRANFNFAHPFRITRDKVTSLVFDFDTDGSVIFSDDEYTFLPSATLTTELSGARSDEAQDLINKQRVENIKERAKRG